jgi:hypothetical protein
MKRQSSIHTFFTPADKKRQISRMEDPQEHIDTPHPFHNHDGITPSHIDILNSIFDPPSNTQSSQATNQGNKICN